MNLGPRKLLVLAVLRVADKPRAFCVAELTDPWRQKYYKARSFRRAVSAWEAEHKAKADKLITFKGTFRKSELAMTLVNLMEKMGSVPAA